MPLTLHTALPADIPALTDIGRAAFAPTGPHTYWPRDNSLPAVNGPVPNATPASAVAAAASAGAIGDGGDKATERPTDINALFRTQDPSKPEVAAEIRASYIQRYEKAFSNGDVRIMKVVETPDRGEGGDGEEQEEEAIALAHWVFHLAGSEEGREYVEKERKGEHVEEEETKYSAVWRAELKRDFSGGMNRARREIMKDRPYIYLRGLAAKPAHHRKGAASMLLKWGIERSDGAGLPIYLESSKKGKPVYEKFGFEILRVLEIDLEKYGGNGVHRQWIMFRKPRQKDVN
ncbi:MAG: hypothetical protein M1821_001111 [Bathelium mastoideum]|nr:MAG: hypothetical protein M1821_001111 [Bathelium mastoideum]